MRIHDPIFFSVGKKNKIKTSIDLMILLQVCLDPGSFVHHCYFSIFILLLQNLPDHLVFTTSKFFEILH